MIVNQDQILMLYPKWPLGGVTSTAYIFLVNNQSQQAIAIILLPWLTIDPIYFG